MDFLPTDLKSFVWGLAVAALGIFVTSFLKEAGKDAWTLLKGKFFPDFRNEAQKKDRAILDKFLTEFPSSGKLCVFLQDQDVAAPFSNKVMYELDNLIDNWNDAEHEFQNKKIEKQRKKLWEVASRYGPELAKNVFSAGSHDLLAMELNVQDQDLRKKREQKRIELNETGTQIFREHQELVRLAKKYT